MFKYAHKIADIVVDRNKISVDAKCEKKIIAILVIKVVTVINANFVSIIFFKQKNIKTIVA
jgi:hypothetical protein